MRIRLLKVPPARAVAWLSGMLVLAGVLAACGTAGSVSDSSAAPSSTTPSSAPSSALVTANNSGQCTGTSGGRQPPIIYRPAGLSRSTKVPLVMAFYSFSGTPQSAQGVTKFESLADRYGFVVAYPASVGQGGLPWLPRYTDNQYVSSLIDCLKASENIDPSRVYLTGFSAGGNETFQAACTLSRKVAAVAIVAMVMRPALYHSCPLARPLSEMLIVGSADGIRYSGTPGRVPSATQTTAKWRSLDGCPAAGNTYRVSTIVEYVWTGCNDGSGVQLYVVQGGQHAWPGQPGLPASDPSAKFNASQAIWSFFSAHPAGPLTLSGQLLGLTVNSSRQVVASFRLNDPVRARATLRRRHRYLVLRFARLMRGTARLVLVVPRTAGSGRYSVTMLLTDSYGRTLRLTRIVTLPT